MTMPVSRHSDNSSKPVIRPSSLVHVHSLAKESAINRENCYRMHVVRSHTTFRERRPDYSRSTTCKLTYRRDTDWHRVIKASAQISQNLTDWHMQISRLYPSWQLAGAYKCMQRFEPNVRFASIEAISRNNNKIYLFLSVSLLSRLRWNNNNKKKKKKEEEEEEEEEEEGYDNKFNKELSRKMKSRPSLSLRKGHFKIHNIINSS